MYMRRHSQFRHHFDSYSSGHVLSGGKKERLVTPELAFHAAMHDGVVIANTERCQNGWGSDRDAEIEGLNGALWRACDAL